MANNIEKLRRARGMTLSELATKCGTTISTITKLIRGERRLNQDWQEKIALAFGVPIQDILSDSSPRLVPVVGTVGGGAMIFPIDDYAKGGGIDEVEAPPNVDPASVVAVRVSGDSMYPAYQDGDILYYRKECDFDPSYIGKECVVMLKSGQALVKRLHRCIKPERFRLESYNAPPMHDVRVEWACPVLWVKK